MLAYSHIDFHSACQITKSVRPGWHAPSSCAESHRGRMTNQNRAPSCKSVGLCLVVEKMSSSNRHNSLKTCSPGHHPACEHLALAVKMPPSEAPLWSDKNGVTDMHAIWGHLSPSVPNTCPRAQASACHDPPLLLLGHPATHRLKHTNHLLQRVPRSIMIYEGFGSSCVQSPSPSRSLISLLLWLHRHTKLLALRINRSEPEVLTWRASTTAKSICSKKANKIRLCFHRCNRFSVFG